MKFNPDRYVRLFAKGRQIGWLQPELAARLSAWPSVFKSSPEKVVLLQHEDLDPIVRQLAQEGFISGWRNERYRIADLFEIERAAARPFGLTTHAVHLNGIVGNHMWLARRASSKAIDPGKLDNLVGGGIAAGFSIEQTLLKEAWEEAGIPADLARGARRGGTVTILREVPEGVQSETVHVYDLVLPRDLEPKNQDGEVSEFILLPFERVLEGKALTLEAELAAKDYFSRAKVP
jgi:8-oxo-dGTP pyrophosphatase MutT (NUDIX family)